jgi:hypothetical protein
MQCLISKTKLMVFGLKSIGSVVLLLNDGHEGRCAASGVCREMAWVVRRVIRNCKCKQALQHRPVSALVPRVYTECRDVLSPSRQLCVCKRTVLSVERQRNIVELRLCLSCVICVCVLIVSCRAMLNLMFATSFLTADCSCFSFNAL